MPNPNRHGCHTISRLTVHLVWVTKYRYKVLSGDVQKRCRTILLQLCDSEDIKIHCCPVKLRKDYFVLNPSS